MDNNGALRIRPDTKPLGHHAFEWRIERRIRLCSRFPHGSLCTRERWRRFYPHPGK
jgi:hypothetical protein